MTIRIPFHLTPQDKSSAVWSKLLAFMVQQREELRIKNDGPLEALETASIRGQIRQLSILIDMDKDRPDTTVPEQY